MRTLEGKNAIVTGANRGIGNAIVRDFALNGCNVWACARRKSDDFERDMAEISAQNNVWIKPVYFELTNSDEIKEGFKTIHKEKMAVDILVNAAGILNKNIFQMTPMKTVRHIFDVNLFGPMELTQYVLKMMTRYKKGSIVNIASVAAEDYYPTNCSYGSSKAALIAFSRQLATEIGGSGIRVNVVEPGGVMTDMMVQSGEETVKHHIEHAALKRIAEPKEVASVCTFLASDKASYVNGTVVRVDGGKIG